MDIVEVRFLEFDSPIVALAFVAGLVLLAVGAILIRLATRPILGRRLLGGLAIIGGVFAYGWLTASFASPRWRGRGCSGTVLRVGPAV
jgi:hypothetical protein